MSSPSEPNLETSEPHHAAEQPGLDATILEPPPRKSRFRALGIAGVALAGLAALAFIVMAVMRVLGIGPGTSLIASGRMQPGHPVLVTDWPAPGGDTVLAGVMTAAMRLGLGRSSAILVVSPERTAAVARTQQSPGTTLDLTLARRLAPRLGGAAIVTGEVGERAAGWRLVTRLYGADGTELTSAAVDVVGQQDLIDGMDRLANDLRRRIGESKQSVRDGIALHRVATASVTAWRLFTRAARHMDVDARADLAVPLLRTAITMDTGFALARWRLAGALHASGAPEAAVDSAFDAAFRAREPLVPHDRVRLEAAYFSLPARRHRALAVAALDSLLRMRDSTPETLTTLSALMLSRRQYARAESLSAAAVAVDPAGTASAAYDVFFRALAAQSRMTRLQSVIDELQRTQAVSALAVTAPVRALYVNAEYDRVLSAADSLRASPDSAVRSAAAGLAARLRLLHGRVGAYQRLAFARGIASPWRALLDSALVSFQDAWYFGRTEPAILRLDAALAATPLDARAPDAVVLRLATVYAMLGQPTRARALLDSLAATSRDSTRVRLRQPGVHRALGELALAEGRPLDAIREFRRADSLPDGPVGDPLQTMVDLGRAFNDANEPDSAVTWFERFVNAPAWDRDSLDAIYLPRVHEMLAELYDVKGDGARAVSHYGRFAQLWRSADRDLQPAVAAARRRLSELTR